MSRFGSRMRSTWERLVFSNTAMRALEIFFLHRPSQLPRNDLLDCLLLRFLKDVFFLQEVVNARSHIFLTHLLLFFLAANSGGRPSPFTVCIPYPTRIYMRATYAWAARRD